MFYWIVAILAFLVVAAYFSLRQESDDTGGDFGAFVKKDTSSSNGQPKPKKKEETTDEVYNTPGRQILILYGTAYGFSEILAKKLYFKLKKETEPSLNIQPRCVNMKSFDGFIDLTLETTVFVIVSTAGDGVPPADARDFFDYLAANQVKLASVQYALLALGDTAYPHFCRAGRTLDARFVELGAQSITPRVDVDREDWPVLDGWMDVLMTHVNSEFHVRPEQQDYLSSRAPSASTSLYSRTNPYYSTITTKYCLTQLGQKEDKEIIHMEFDLGESGLTYQSGDAIGIVPVNHPTEVQSLLKAWSRTGTERIFSPYETTLREILTNDFDLKQVKTSLLVCLQNESSPSTNELLKLNNILQAGDSKSNKPLQDYLHHKEVLDILMDFPKAAKSLTIRNMLVHLRPLQPRYYSISSSPLVNDKIASVTAAVVRYELNKLPRTGVCTTYLSDRRNLQEEVKVFISSNPDFRLPVNTQKPIIMIGPGTGIAPFRAFLQERILTKSTGKNVLYYGCRYKARDFTYREELEKMETEGNLTLRCAFSRDQAKKVYVQHLIEEDGKSIVDLLRQEAHIYICGDGASMAVDVQNALENILVKYMPDQVKSQEDATQYIAKLTKEGRFEKDVWIT